METNVISGMVVDAALRVHRALGPGLLESVYQAALGLELTRRGLEVRIEVPVPANYGGVALGIGFRADLIVEDAVLIEVKALDRIHQIHKRQVMTYLRVAGLRLGLLLNFGRETIREGITRLVNRLPE